VNRNLAAHLLVGEGLPTQPTNANQGLLPLVHEATGPGRERMAELSDEYNFDSVLVQERLDRLLPRARIPMAQHFPKMKRVADALRNERKFFADTLITHRKDSA
jgi:hypothetical protein